LAGLLLPALLLAALTGLLLLLTGLLWLPALLLAALTGLLLLLAGFLLATLLILLTALLVLLVRIVHELLLLGSPRKYQRKPRRFVPNSCMKRASNCVQGMERNDDLLARPSLRLSSATW
jgi:hypothetical protein